MLLGQQNEVGQKHSSKIKDQSQAGCFPLPANDAPPEIGRRLLAVAQSRPGNR